MRRYRQIDAEIVIKPYETVLKLAQTEVAPMGMEMMLLLESMCESLTLRGQRGASVLIALLPDRDKKHLVVSRISAHKLRFDLPQNLVEYFLAVLLRAFRDGMAEVDHIHLEGDFGDESYDLTVKFALFRPPMSAEEAARLMDEE